uniref:Alpha-2-macroglobulin-like 1 n=1 Tax=Xenopus tropicalis TaxID=8364 RepID=A0A803K6Y1_XENTR
MVLLRALGLALALLHLSGTLEAKLHYVVIFPSELVAPHSEQACVHLSGAEGDSRIQVTLNMAERNSTVIERNLQQKSLFSCVTFQVPPPSEGNEEVATMEILIESAGETITNSSKVLVRKRRTSTFIQTDKVLYKPGDTVQIRVVNLEENLQLKETRFRVIYIQDPNQRHIAWWQNVNLTQGIAELSFPLSPEPSFGFYYIHVGDIKQHFFVTRFALHKYEVVFQFPKAVLSNSEQFQLKICGRYPNGQPVQGTYQATVCRWAFSVYWSRHFKNFSDLCVDFSGKLEQSGCSILQVKSDTFRIAYNTHEMDLEGVATITEEETGLKYSGRGRTTISPKLKSCRFLDGDITYKPGIPYSGTIKVMDGNDDPLPNQKVSLTISPMNITENLVSDENGLVSFQLDNTTAWEGKLRLTASPEMEKSADMYSGLIIPVFGKDSLELKLFESPSKSFLKLHSQQGELPCEGQRDVRVEYIIPNSALGMEAKHMELHYLVASKGSVKDSGSVEVPITSEGGGSSELRGEVSIKLTLSADVSPTLRALAFISLPNGELVADSATFKLQRCFKNKVSVGFSPDEVLPGADVSLQVQAAAGSLCGLRVVDQSVVLMKPDKELTADQIHNLFPFPDFGGYDARVQDSDDHCPFYPWFHRPMWKRSIVLPPWHMPHEDEVDVYSLFKDMRLKIVTSAEIKKPLRCREPEFALQYNVLAHPRIADAGDGLVRAMPKAVGVGNELTEPAAEIIRAYFPETWIWQLEPVGESGRAEVHGSAPDTITEWNAGAFCMGPSGFGISPPTSLRAFQPFFVELTLPYSVVRGESFTLKASVFNYLKQCIKVQTTLQPSLELEQEPCADCQYSSCICADESKTFYWNLKASNLGEVNITVRTEALNTQDMCNNEIPIVPKQGHSDTVIKPLLVQPGGVLIEKSHSSLICSPEGEDHSKTEDISLNVPENILEGSERAYVTALGDLMGTAMQNLDRLLAMPYGCGEQNMVLFAPNIFILQYLENTHQLSPEIQTKAKGFLESGYQRQLTYKRNDGSYSAFGSRDPEGNTWLTAFVVKSFSKARPYIFIDGDHLNHSFSWLKDKRQRSGCFRSVGKLFNNAMKGGVDDEISLSAYVTIALMEAGLSKEDPMVSDALSCLRKAARKVSSAYTQALLAYTFTLSDDTKHREKLLAKLEEKAVRKDGQLHWERKPASKASDLPYWYRAPSAEVELTSYALLALLSGPNKDLGKASEIVNWLSKQQNPYGGFSSTQDTVVALQALAKYAEATFSDKGDVTVTVTSKTGFHQQFHVDQTNRLLLQKASLPDIPGEYSLSATGSSCVYVQTVLRYNIPPPRSDATFSVRVETQPKQCPQEPMKQMHIDIYIQYTGSREKSNMALVEVKMLSGFIPVKSTIKQLVSSNTIKRSEIQTDMVTLYLNELGHDPVHFSIMVEQDIEVKNLKPATVKVYDYYETAEHAVTEYNSPCSSDKEAENTR